MPTKTAERSAQGPKLAAGVLGLFLASTAVVVAAPAAAVAAPVALKVREGGVVVGAALTCQCTSTTRRAL